MRRLRKIGSIINGKSTEKNQRPICNDRFTMLPNEVHAALAKYLNPRIDIKHLCLVNRTLFKAYIALYWRGVHVRSMTEVDTLNKLGKATRSKKAVHDYFAHIQYLAIELWDEMDHGKDVARLIDRVAGGGGTGTGGSQLRWISVKIGAAWGEEIQQALIDKVSRQSYIELGIATKRLISLDLHRIPHANTVELRVDFGNVGWLTPLSRSIETLTVTPDVSAAKRQLRARDVDLQRTLSSAKYLRQLKLDWVVIQSDGSTSWLPPSVTDLTLSRCNFDVVCFEEDEEVGEDDDEVVVPVAENVTRLTVCGSAAAQQQVFMQFPRLHTLSLVNTDSKNNSAEISATAVTTCPIDSTDMANLQCLHFNGYAYEDVAAVIASACSSTMNRLPASTLTISAQPTGWLPYLPIKTGNSSTSTFLEWLEMQMPNLSRVHLDCRALAHADVPFSIQLRNAIIELIMRQGGNNSSKGAELVFDYGDPEMFVRVCFAGGVDIGLEDTLEPPLQRIAAIQGQAVMGTVLVK